MTSEITWDGMPALQGFLRAAPQNGQDAMAGLIGEVLTDVFQESQKQVPVDTGALQKSGGVEVPNSGSNNIVGSVYYTARYAFFVHENLHVNHPRGGKAKFLEDPMNNAINDLTGKARAQMEAAIMGGGTHAGSRNHAAESQAMSTHSNRRSLAQRRGIREDQVSEMLKRAESYRHMAPGQRPTVVSRRGRVGLKFFGGSEERHGEFHYQPPKTRSGEIRGRIPRESMSTRSIRSVETLFSSLAERLRKFGHRRDFNA